MSMCISRRVPQEAQQLQTCKYAAANTVGLACPKSQSAASKLAHTHSHARTTLARDYEAFAGLMSAEI
eukprot:4405881-Pleurochrysis_carterae.AAC.1